MKVGCDVYVGPRVSNPSWDLERSRWFPPGGRATDEHYVEWLLSRADLMGDIGSLAGKTLGCLCPNTLTCHAHVLARLADASREGPASSPPAEFVTKRFLFFKGSDSPFSHYHNVPLTTADGTQAPHGALQLYAYKKARDGGEEDLAERILSSAHQEEVVSHLGALDAKLKGTGRPWTTAETVGVLRDILEDKYRCDEAFRMR